jgi:hypothetical protein
MIHQRTRRALARLLSPLRRAEATTARPRPCRAGHLARLLTLPLALAAGLSAAPARAWDPTTTHLGLVEVAARQSALHLRWMAASELTRGLFTPLRIDPARLQPAERRLILQAIARASDASGARPLGGPGSCPGAAAPAITQIYCVIGDTWQNSALGWLELGVLAELAPSARAVHHFLDRRDPSSPTWADAELPAWLLRLRQARHNGAALATTINRTGFSGHGPSAISWLRDEVDLLAPPRTFAHLERAALAAEPEERQHHLAMALLGVGALLHVVQDLTVPAHARGDASAFFAALSGEAGDRGLPLQEYARRLYGRRDLPITATEEQLAAARGRPLTDSLLGHLLGAGEHEGAAHFTARRFLSESSVPAPLYLDDDLSAQEAAARLLERAALDPIETDGARLAPWPAARGYLLSSRGRPLAAFERDEDGLLRAFLDEIVYRDQTQALLPLAAQISRSLLDRLWPGWPTITIDRAQRTIELEISADLTAPVLLVLTQDADGRRTIARNVALTPGERNRVRDLPVVDGAARLILVLRASGAGGDPYLWELVLSADATTVQQTPPPYVPKAGGEALSEPDDDDDDLVEAPPPTAQPPLPLEDDEPEEEDDEEPAEPEPEPPRAPAARRPGRAG